MSNKQITSEHLIKEKVEENKINHDIITKSKSSQIGNHLDDFSKFLFKGSNSFNKRSSHIIKIKKYSNWDSFEMVEEHIGNTSEQINDIEINDSKIKITIDENSSVNKKMQGNNYNENHLKININPPNSESKKDNKNNKCCFKLC